MKQILSTKILASHQKKWLLNAGLSVVEFDFIKIKTKDFQIQKLYDFLIFTSQNSVNKILNHPTFEQLKAKKCFCVGDKTAYLLESHGFIIVQKAANAASLAKLIITHFQSSTFTFFSGASRLDILPKMLTDSLIIWNEIAVYETISNPQKLAIFPDGILFFSPSGVLSYLKNNNIHEAQCFCIGQTTASELKNNTKKITVANHTTVENVIVQCINHFKKNRN
jgi:uroporphyrinogen-III synthase